MLRFSWSISGFIDLRTQVTLEKNQPTGKGGIQDQNQEILRKANKV